MNDFDSEEPLSTLSESSFVILGQGSLPALLNDDVKKNGNSSSFSKNKRSLNIYESTDSNSDDKFQSIWGSHSSLSEEEIQRKLDELVKENSQLKEILSQNNLAIKSQLDTFLIWQQEVLKTHETHKRNFLETKELILKLRAENVVLKKHLEGSSKCSNQIPSNKDDVYAQINKKAEDFTKLEQTLEEYKQLYSDLSERNENLDSENQKLKEELKSTKNEVLKLNCSLEDIERENIFLRQKSDEFYKNSLKNLSHKSLLSSEACLQKNNLLKLTKELEKTESNDQDALLNSTENLSHCIEKLNSMNDSFYVQNQRYSGLQSWISLTEENLKENKSKISERIEATLVGEIKQLKSHLNQEECVFREKQESLVELKDQFHKLLEDYKALKLKLTSLKNNDSVTENHKEDALSLLTRLEAKDKELIAKQQECDNFKEVLQKLNSECEEIAILRVQVQLYQSDFNDERAAREKLVGEKEEMAEEIRHLQNRITALEEEKEPAERKKKYKCPKCLNSFFDLSECEEHIEECLNYDFLL